MFSNAPPASDTAVWRALGDPARRQMLDHLRRGPMTTGELAAHFDQSRFGVMKHLAILERAGLVSVRREGRNRWNHLNAVPLREIYQRWLGPYQELWSTSLSQLRDCAESTSEQGKDQHMTTSHAFEIQQQVTLRASSDKVWAALTSDIGRWWAHRVGDAGSYIRLDARLEGAFEERWGDGDGRVWGHVIEIRWGKKLRLRGNLGHLGACLSDWVYELDAKGEQTVLRLYHHAVGARDEKSAKEYDEGWRELLQTHLPAWVQEGKPFQPE
jgi:DNA-binding transcriptional ArsR family regulator/uncharacterized protein YndB with AHSA1/START domain